MEHIFALAGVIDLQAAQFIGWAIAIGSGVLAIYFGRKAKPIEKLSLDLSVIQTRNEFLEKRIETLEKSLETCRAELVTTKTDYTALQVLHKVTQENLTVSLEQATTQINELSTMKSQVISSQVAASLMRNQVNAITRRFSIPDSLSDLRGEV